MKNSVLKLACIALLATASNFAIAQNETKPLGIKVGMAFDQGFGVTAQFSNDINVFLGNDGLAADYILKRGEFGPDIPFQWYVGVGGAMNWDNSYSHYHNDGTWHGEDYNSYKARVPLGVTLPFAKNWDVYGQLAPALEYRNKPHDSDFEFGLDFALGIRYAF